MSAPSFLNVLLLWIEHWANHEVEHASGNSKLLPLTVVLMLSIHSVLMGAAFGISSSVAMTVVIFIAVLAHKGSASFALGLELGRSSFSRASAWRLFLVFVIMFPIGALLGESVSKAADAHPLVEASISAAAAGTFLFFGTLHGLASTPLIQRCCNQREFVAALGGFAVMAVVAVWTRCIGIHLLQGLRFWYRSIIAKSKNQTCIKREKFFVITPRFIRFKDCSC